MRLNILYDDFVVVIVLTTCKQCSCCNHESK